jgi:hypothetical protein
MGRPKNSVNKNKDNGANKPIAELEDQRAPNPSPVDNTATLEQSEGGSSQEEVNSSPQVITPEEAENSAFEEDDVPLTEEDAEFQVEASPEQTAKIEDALQAPTEPLQEESGTPSTLVPPDTLESPIELIKTVEIDSDDIDEEENTPEQEETPSEDNIPTHVLYDGQGKPIPAKEILLGFSKEKASYHLTTMVEEILYIASLGGDWNKSFFPRVKNLPFQVKMLIPEKNYQTYVDRNDMYTYDEDTEYKKVGISAVDTKTFMDQLVRFGKNGCIIAPNTAVLKSMRFSCTILTRSPVAPEHFIRVSANKVKYTREELKDFDMEQIRTLGREYGLTGRGKNDLIKDILKEQDK